MIFWAILGVALALVVAVFGIGFWEICRLLIKQERVKTKSYGGKQSSPGASDIVELDHQRVVASLEKAMSISQASSLEP